MTTQTFTPLVPPFCWRPRGVPAPVRHTPARTGAETRGHGFRHPGAGTGNGQWCPGARGGETGSSGDGCRHLPTGRADRTPQRPDGPGTRHCPARRPHGRGGGPVVRPGDQQSALRALTRRPPPRKGAARAWDAGHDGRTLVDRICDAAPAVLRPTGVLLVVHSGLCGVDATLDRLTGAGMTPVVTDRAMVPFGPVLRSRLPWLRRTGLVRDEVEEELVVIRAEHA